MAIRLEYSVTAKCRPEHVWQKFEKLEQWSWWNRVISQTKWLEGQPWRKGSRFLLGLARPINKDIPVEILECAAPQKVGWVGKFLGIRAEHWFSFEPQADGTTLMETWEDFSGPGTIFFGNGRREDVVKVYAAWFEALKFEAERIAREEAARS
jgi:hypothetical protein